MRKFVILLGSAVAMSTLAHAENWTGKLLDASCYDRSHNQGQSSQSPGQTPATQAQSTTTPGQQSTTGRSTATAGQDSSCMATASTSSFALEANGKVLKFDENGNTRAMAAFKSHADRSATGGQSTTTPGQTGTQRDVMAKVDGTESGGTIKVTTIELQ